MSTGEVVGLTMIATLAAVVMFFAGLSVGEDIRCKSIERVLAAAGEAISVAWVREICKENLK